MKATGIRRSGVSVVAALAWLLCQSPGTASAISYDPGRELGGFNRVTGGAFVLQTAVPEPANVFLLAVVGIGLVVLAWRRGRRR